MKIINNNNNNNRGNREPLTSEDCTKLYLQIVRVWLDANADSPIDLALRSDNRTNLRELLFMIRKPGLILKLMYKDDGNIEKKLAGEEYESICALESFINNLQNNYGPIEDGMFDITTISRDGFMNFVWNRFDITKPIAYDENKAIASRERNRERVLEFWRSRSEKVANDPYMNKNEKERTMEIHASLSSDEMTRHIAAKVVDAPSLDDAYLTWEEINWNNYPPRSEDQDDSVCTGYIDCHSYIQYVVSQPQVRLQQSLRTIYGDVGTDRLNKITASLGFGEIVQCPTAINDNKNLRRDLGELLDFLEGNNNGKKRLAELLQMVSDYFLTYKTITTLEQSD